MRDFINKPSRTAAKSRWLFLSLLVLSLLSSYRIMLLHVGVSTNVLLIPIQVAVAALCLVCSVGLVRYNRYDALVAAFVFVELLATVVNGLALKSFLMEAAQLVTLCSVARLLLGTFPREFIRYSSVVLCVLTVANTVSAIVVYPDWLYWDEGPFFLLGGDNTSVRIYIIATMFAVLDGALGGSRRIMPLVVIISFATFVALRDIATGKICAFVLILAYIAYYVLRLGRFVLTVRATLLFHGVLFVVLVLLANVELFSDLFVDVLGRNLTLTDRTIIWEVTIGKIVESPLVGYGFVSGDEFESLLPYIIGVNAHNTFLMIQFVGGVVLSLIFVVMAALSALRYDGARHVSGMVILPVALFSMLLHSQVEGGDATYLVYLMLILYNSGDIEGLFSKAEKGLDDRDGLVMTRVS